MTTNARLNQSQELVQERVSTLADVRVSPSTWQRVSLGLYLKLGGQGVGALAVIGWLGSGFRQRTSTSSVHFLDWVFLLLFCVAVGLDVTGRLLCLSAPRKRAGRLAVQGSVAAQAVAVVSVLAGVVWPLAAMGSVSAESLAALILLAVTSQFIAALCFTGFMNQLARHFQLPALAGLSGFLYALLGILVATTVIGLIVIAVAAVIAFYFTIWMMGIGGIVVAVVLGVPFLIVVGGIVGLVQICYAILVASLAVRTSQAARERSELPADL